MSPAPDPARPRRLLVIHNPTAGWRRRRRLARTVDELVRLGCLVTLRRTAAPGDAERFARDGAASGEFDAVVAAGGDGTVNEVINGLAGRALPLGLVPIGTANVLATEIGLGRRPKALAAVIARAGPRAVHVGRADGRRFAIMLGAGFDARTVGRVRPWLKRLAGKGAYVAAGLGQLLAGAGPRLRVTADGRTHEAAWAVVCKGAHYAGGFVLAPGADLSEPGFRLCLFRRGGRADLALALVAIALGRHAWLAGISLIPCRKVRIEGPPDVPTQTDGEIAGRLPVAVEVAPEPLWLLAPEPATRRAGTAKTTC
ncbi:MAG: diacylglycerol kinase family lipid kinase [Proteobacteria bacterium]|nr:diacylglycerol kinase family lipid kinase [Pseudomonadota bacterium]